MAKTIWEDIVTGNGAIERKVDYLIERGEPCQSGRALVGSIVVKIKSLEEAPKKESDADMEKRLARKSDYQKILDMLEADNGLIDALDLLFKDEFGFKYEP